MTAPRQDCDADYAHLLEAGTCERFFGMGSGDPGTPDAEAFHEGLRQRAEADGFLVHTYWTQTSLGSAFLLPGVMLLRPNGDEYEWYDSGGGWISSEERQTTLLPLLESDWGEQLIEARRRARHTFEGMTDQSDWATLF